MLLLASMVLSYSSLLLAPMLLQVFLICCGPTVIGVHDLALVHDVASIHAVAGGSSVVSPAVTGVHALVFTHALASVPAIVGSTVAGVIALGTLQDVGM
jgi:hypothetical protein